tara:strand:+ start:704 stop:1615 length:912 start_codon:yes stop_codon:yes gene_type:complete
MGDNSFSRLWVKLFNKKNYNNYKYNLNQKKKLNYYNQNIDKDIKDISRKLEHKKSLSFLHSGHLGDIIYSLPLIKELSKNYECNFYLQVNKKMDVKYENHPSGDVMINQKTAELTLPLLKNQKFINSAKIYQNEEIDIDLDLFRKVPINVSFHSIRWYSHLTGTPINMLEPFLDVEGHSDFKDKIVIMRSPRYRNQYINYQFLNNVKNIVCIGLETEYEDLKKDIPNLEFYDCKDFLEMAKIIKSSKFFLGNLCFSYSIAEGLKVPRLLEACPDFPVVFPIGGEAYDFYHQIHFEKYFKKLNY